MRNLTIFFVVLLLLLLSAYAGYSYFLKDNKEVKTEQNDTTDDELEEVITSTEDVRNLINTNPNTKIFKNRIDDSNIYADLEESEVEVYTVLIPTDVAFSELNEELGDLSDSEKEQLLKNHIVLESLSPERILELKDKEIETFAGTKLKILIEGGIVIFQDEKGNQAKISEPNLKVTGGYVYLVDSVLGI